MYKAMEISSGQTIAVKTIIRKGLKMERVKSTLQEQTITRRIASAQAKGTQYKGEQFVVRMIASFLTPSHFVFVLVCDILEQKPITSMTNDPFGTRTFTVPAICVM